MTWNIVAFNEWCMEREKGFINVLLMEKLRDWYYITPWKKKSIYPISNTRNILVTEKLHFLENYPNSTCLLDIAQYPFLNSHFAIQIDGVIALRPHCRSGIVKLEHWLLGAGQWNDPLLIWNCDFWSGRFVCGLHEIFKSQMICQSC